jgi:hypothetical protein
MFVLVIITIAIIDITIFILILILIMHEALWVIRLVVRYGAERPWHDNCPRDTSDWNRM